MGKATVTREEIQQQLHDDELLGALKRLQTWTKANGRALVFGVIVVILALVVWQMMSYRSERANSQANLDLNSAQMAYEQSLFQTSTGSKERADALEKAALQLRGIRSSFPQTTAARMALFTEAKVLLSMGDKPGETTNTDKARAVFQQYIDSAKSNEDKARGMLGLAAALRNRAWLANQPDENKKAAEVYQKVIGLVGAKNFLAAEAKLGMARIHAEAGEADKAAALYREIIAEQPLIERPKREEAASDQASMSRKMLEKRVYDILDAGSYGSIAKSELDVLLPPSGVDLGLRPPESAPKAETPKKK